MKNTIIIILLALVLSFCGARNAEKTRLHEAQKTEITSNSDKFEKEESNIKENSITKVDDKNETVTEETVYEPSDPSKPASVIDANGKKTVLNNAKKTHKKITQKNNTKTGNSSNSEKFHKSELSELSKFKAKAATKKAAEEIKVDREAWSVWNFLWLLIPIGLIVIIWRNKTKIATWFTSIWWV
jgi:hypothetical protein